MTRTARPRWLAVLGVLLLACLCWPPTQRAHAQPDDPAYHEAITEALAEFDAGNYPEARRHFARAHELSPNARTFRGLGIVSFELRRYSDSVSFCEQALASRVRPLSGSMREETERLLVRARRLVGQLTLEVTPDGSTVTIDDAGPRAIAGAPLLLDVGAHQLEFQHPGYLPQRRAWTVEGGEQERWRIELRPAREDGSAQPAPKRRPLHIALASVATVVGVASFAVAGAYTAKHHGDGAHLRAAMPENEAYPALRSTWHDGRTTPYALGAVGSVALTAGFTGWAVMASREGFPWWASTLSGAAGAGLLAWGIADIAGGGSCDAPSDRQRACSARQEKRDRGALVVLAAVPLLSVPVARWLRGSSRDGREVALVPSLDLRRSASLVGRFAW